MVDLKDELKSLEKNREKYHKVFPGYITHIRFPRYKNIAPNVRIDFSFPVTALVGINGSGKTSVLNALYGAPMKQSTGNYWFSTEVDPIEEGEGSPNRFIYGHYNSGFKQIVETRKARVRKFRNGKMDPNYWEPTKESPGDGMVIPTIPPNKKIDGRSQDRWNPVTRKVLYINFRKELSAFDKYFYFGKDPANAVTRVAPATKTTGKTVLSRRIMNKMDQVRRDAGLLARVIISGDTAEMSRNRKIATENRLLTTDELKMVSFVLGRDYVEARWIRHRLFKGEGGLSIIFKTKFGRYSEAFAGSGEVAVSSCVVQAMAAAKGTLLLLDEPEVSLHPGAQERLLAFLAQMARKNQLQIVFSTHSPHLIGELPDDAIKTFYQLPDGTFGVIPATHPYAAFRRLGLALGTEVLVLVEDRLARGVVRQAISLIEDEAAREIFKVEYVQGGASSILNSRIPVLMERTGNVLVLLDGDQRRVTDIQDPDTIPEAQNNALETFISDQVGAKPTLLIDGGAGGGNDAQKVTFRRNYLRWVRRNLKYIPTTCPEELVLRAAGLVQMESANDSQVFKNQLKTLVSQRQGWEASSEEIDNYGLFLLTENKTNSVALADLAFLLKEFLAVVRPQ